MPGSSKFRGAPQNVDTPNKYLVTYTDEKGRGGSEFTIPHPDPALDPLLSDEEAAEKVKDMLLQDRGDFYLRGINEGNLNVVKVGPATAEDIQRRDSIRTRAANVRNPAAESK